MLWSYAGAGALVQPAKLPRHLIVAKALLRLQPTMRGFGAKHDSSSNIRVLTLILTSPEGRVAAPARAAPHRLRAVAEAATRLLAVALLAVALLAVAVAPGCSGIGGGSSSKGGGGSSTATTGGAFVDNEGSVTNPVLLAVGQPWVGMVNGGTSYYTFQKASGTSVVATLTPDNTGPINLSVQLTNQSNFSAGCGTWTAALAFTVPTTTASTFNSFCALGNTTANQAWYLAITQSSGLRGADYSITITTP